MKQRSEEWFEARKSLDVTGSTIGAILGNSPFMKREDVIRAKVRERHGAEKEFIGNAATDWGQENEGNALAAFENLFGHIVLEDGLKVHESLHFIGYSPDGIVNDRLLEIKCPYSKKIPDEVPQHYIDQVQLGMEVYGLNETFFFYWTPDFSSCNTIKRDKDYFNDVIKPAALEFRQELNDEMSNPNHLEPLVQDFTGDPGWKILAEKYEQAQLALAKATAEHKEIKDKIISFAGDKSSTGHGLTATKVMRKGNVNYAKVPQLEGVDLEQYRGKSTFYWKIS